MLLLVGTCLVAFVLLLYMLSPLISPKPLALPGAHVVVSGLPGLRRHLPARAAGPARPFSPPRVPCRRAPGAGRAEALGDRPRRSWLLPVLRGPEPLGDPGASLGWGCFCPQFSRRVSQRRG